MYKFLIFIVGFWLGALVVLVMNQSEKVCQEPIGEYRGYDVLDADHIIREWVYRDTIVYDWHPDLEIKTSSDTLKIE